MTVKAGLHKQDQVQMKKLMVEGATAKQIAKHLGCQLDVTKRFFKEFSKTIKPKEVEKEE